MKPDVLEAIAEIERAAIGSGVRSAPDSDGGAYVVIDGVDVGESFDPPTTWIGFHIVWTYAEGDVYPHFIGSELKYVGSRPTPNQSPAGNLPEALARGQEMPGFKLAAIQVSRRSNRRNAETDSALLKTMRVIEFLRSL
jgi:hypothetical protein